VNNIPHIIDSGSSYMPGEEIKIGFHIVSENPDGSADATIRFNKAGLECLVQWGLIKMIEEGLKTYAPVPTTRRKPRANAGSAEKRRSRAVAKGKTRVASKVRKAKKA
jgi:hypothetical protein